MEEPEHQDPKLKRIEKLLTEQQKLAVENNQILRKMQRERRLQFWGRILWFIIMIALAAIAYIYYIEPMLTPILEFYDGAGAAYEDFSFEGLLEQIQQQ